MSPKRKVPWRNRNASGWWIASYIERFEYYDEPKRDLRRRCLAWENTVIVKASSREVAHRKAMAIGRLSEGSEMWNARGRTGAWCFEGLTMFLPIYDKLEDGAEVLWTEYAGRTVRRVKNMVLSKKNLPVFDDSENGETRSRTRRRSAFRSKVVTRSRRG